MSALVYDFTENKPAGAFKLDLLTCIRCGRKTVREEMRDSSFRDPLNPPPRRSFGHWRVCECGHEWPIPGWIIGEVGR